MGTAPLGTTAEYNRPSGAVRTEEGRQIESGSVGKHEWSFGKRGLGMTQEGLGALPGLGIRAGRAVLRWNKASRLMRRKTSTDMVNLNCRIFAKVPEKVPILYSICQKLCLVLPTCV